MASSVTVPSLLEALRCIELHVNQRRESLQRVRLLFDTTGATCTTSWISVNQPGDASFNINISNSDDMVIGIA